MMRRVPLLTLLTLSAAAVAGPVTPFSTATGATLPPTWQVITLPKIPRHTQYPLVRIDGRVAVKAEASASYATVCIRRHGRQCDAGAALRVARRSLPGQFGPTDTSR
jgi:hypothetical protein